MRNIFLCSHACCFLALVGLICLLWVNCFTQGETVFMSPPWGGPDYAKVDVYDIKTMLKPCDGLVPSSRVVCLSFHSQMLTSSGWIFFRYSLFKLGTSIASRVVMFLPRNIDQNQLADMCLSVDPPWAVEVEKNFLNGKLKAITAYFEQQDGSDVQDASDTNPQNPEYHA
jgi:trimethylguanosine synthase